MLLSTAASSRSGYVMIVWVVVLVIFMYFVMIRPGRKEQAKKNDMLSRMAVGDTVLTTSGFYGTLIDIQDDIVIVEFGNNKNCRIPMQLGAIAQIEHAEDASAAIQEEEEPAEEKPAGIKGLFKR